MLAAVLIWRPAVGSEGTMQAGLGRMPWAVVWLFLVLVASARAEPSSPEQLRAWLRDLAAEDFAVREQAGRNLAAAGEAAVGTLAEAITSTDSEVAWRASCTLEQIALRGDDVVVARVARELERLSEQGKPGLVVVAKGLRAKQAQLRRDRAVATIRSLGGKFDGDAHEAEVPLAVGGLEIDAPAVVVELLSAPPADAKAPPPPPAPPPDAPPLDGAPPAPAFLAPAIGEAFVGDLLLAGEAPLIGLDEQSRQSLVIDQAWRGSEAGLALLRDLPEIRSLALHRAPLHDAALDQIATLPNLESLDIERTSITSAGLEKLRERRPDIRIFARGDAILGVHAEMSGPCILTGVQASSGASEAGLREGDQILTVDGRKVRDFSDLTIAVFARQPGESVRVAFLRSAEPQVTDVVLKPRNPAR